MPVTLGALTLSEDLVLDGLDAAPVRVNQRRTLAGRSVTQSAPMPGGRTLTLSGEHHWTYDLAAAIRALSGIGQPVTLNHHRATLQVLIVGIELEPFFTHANPSGSEWLSGSITLLEV